MRVLHRFTCSLSLLCIMLRIQYFSGFRDTNHFMHVCSEFTVKIELALCSSVSRQLSPAAPATSDFFFSYPLLLLLKHLYSGCCEYCDFNIVFVNALCVRRSLSHQINPLRHVGSWNMTPCTELSWPWFFQSLCQCQPSVKSEHQLWRGKVESWF